MRTTIFTILLLLLATTGLSAQSRPDTRCLDFQGIPLEGSADSLVSQLKQQGFTEWGTSDDGSELHFRGDYYGVRVKLLVSTDSESGRVSSAYVTIGPYSSKSNYERNLRYFLYKLQQTYGELTPRNGAYYYIGTYGIVKLSDVINDNGTRDIKVFYFPTATFYKDALAQGLKGNVMEVITENPVAENPVEHFDKEGRLEQADITQREYDCYGYLLRAVMTEPSGDHSQLEYTYDEQFRLKRRTLTNPAAGIRYVNEYTYGNGDDIASQVQRVFDKNDKCLLSITLKNHYEAFDDNGNWTRNSLKLTYWEQETGTQQSTVVQTRTISYWEDD